MEISTGKTIGGYALLREIGRGGMSTVFAAREERTGRTVALKLLALPAALTPAQQRDLVARFAREARAVAHLSHPNVIAIEDLGEEEGRHFLVMEYLDGETLRQRLTRGPLTPAQALPILSQVAEAVDAVHAAGVVHRDIKPSNVMLLPDGTAKLLDFGVSRQSDDTTITSTGAIIGSPAYMAPEQVRGEPGSPRSDLWALGVLLYEMLAGHPPFTGPSIPSVLYQVTHEPPAPVIGQTSAVTRVLRRALDKNPQRRYPTARALAGALEAALPRFRAERTQAMASSLPWVRGPVHRSWAWLLALPVLLGLGLVALTHHRISPVMPALVAPPTGAPTSAAEQPPYIRITELKNTAHPGAFAARQQNHPAVPTPHRAVSVPHHARRSHGRRLHRIRSPRHSVRRFVPRRSRGHFDPAASRQLQKFIYSPEM